MILQSAQRVAVKFGITNDNAFVAYQCDAMLECATRRVREIVGRKSRSPLGRDELRFARELDNCLLDYPRVQSLVDDDHYREHEHHDNCENVQKQPLG